MKLERLELTYSIEQIGTETGEKVPWVWVGVERFTCHGATGGVGKHMAGLMSEVVAASGIVRKAFIGILEGYRGQHPRDEWIVASHLREAVIPTAQTLTRLLIPEGLGAEILSAEAPLVIEFRVDPVLNQVPWELLFLGQDFLSFTHATGRLVMSHTAHPATPRRSRQGVLRGAFIVDPCPIGEDRLENVLVHDAMQVMSRWGREVGGERIRFASEATRVRDPIPATRLSAILQHRDLVLVLGHNNDLSRATPDAPEEEGLVIVDERGRGPALYSPAEMLRALQPPNVPPELLFWLACESALSTGWGDDWPNHKRIYGFVDAAVRAGVTHFIGSSVVVPQVVAVDLVEPFLLALAMGCSVGEALRRARVAARRGSPDPADGGSLVGLAFSLFGRPSQGLLSGGGLRIGGQGAHPCQHVENRVRCGALYLPGDSGAAHQRCAAHTLIPEDSKVVREPCGDPYGDHGRVPEWVSPDADGWDGAVRFVGKAEIQPMRLCDVCRGKALIRGELVQLQDLV